jgi:Flp pilus assembly protein TadB
MLHTGAGQAMIVLAVGMVTAGSYVIKRITEIDL